MRARFARSAAPLFAPFSFAVAALALAGFFSSGARPAPSTVASVSATYHLAAPRRALAHIAYQLKMRDPAKCAQLLLIVGLALLPSSIEGGVAGAVVEGTASALAFVPYIGEPCAGGLRYAAAFALSAAATVRSWSRYVLRPRARGALATAGRPDGRTSCSPLFSAPPRTLALRAVDSFRRASASRNDSFFSSLLGVGAIASGEFSLLALITMCVVSTYGERSSGNVLRGALDAAAARERTACRASS